MKNRTMTLLLAVLLSGCGGNRTEETGMEEGYTERWKGELIQADEAFSETIGREGLSRWGSFFTSDGSVIREGVGEIRGVDAIQASMDAAAGAVTSFSWQPERAEVSSAGDLGYTLGRYQTQVMGPDGVELLSTGMHRTAGRLRTGSP